jgi:hypothetical protein
LVLDLNDHDFPASRSYESELERHISAAQLLQTFAIRQNKPCIAPSRLCDRIKSAIDHSLALSLR